MLMKMTITNIEDTDYGEYGCYAENSEGTGENFVKLISKFNCLIYLQLQVQAHMYNNINKGL